MIEQSRRVVVVDAFPNALERVRESLEAAASRGVRVAVEAYAPVTIPGCEVTPVPEGELSIGAWRSEQLNLVIDGSELLLALLDADLARVHQAIWSRSVYLSCILHAGMQSEQTVMKMAAALGREEPELVLRQVVESHPLFRNSDVPGHRELLARYGDVEQAEAPE
jgi:hypothetical protein